LGSTYEQLSREVWAHAESYVTSSPDLLRMYILLRGQSVQYTIVDNQALKAAQKRPDEYRDLIVRTGGYSAFFVELDKETQDSIIARTEHDQV
jgi:pyruvate-formate lyase